MTPGDWCFLPYKRAWLKEKSDGATKAHKKRSPSKEDDLLSKLKAGGLVRNRKDVIADWRIHLHILHCVFGECGSRLQFKTLGEKLNSLGLEGAQLQIST